MPLTPRQRDRAFRLCYGEGKPLGVIAEELKCEIYDLSPWLLASAGDIARSVVREAFKAPQSYVAEAIASFDGDPADSDFQLGYLAALRVVGREALGMEIEDPEVPVSERIARPKLDVIEGGKE